MKEKKNNYFGEIQEQSVIEYLNESDSIKKNMIYEDKLRHVFEEMFENIYYRYKSQHFKSINQDYYDLMSETLSFLTEKMDYFKIDKNKKAYSFYGTIIKRYLIQKNQRNEYIQKKKIDIIDYDDTLQVMNDYYNEENSEYISEFYSLYVEYMERNFLSFFNSELDIKIADSILELFKNRNIIEDFDKKILYVLIRERANLSKKETYKIKDVVNKFHNIWKITFNRFNEHGDLYITSSFF